MENFDEEEERAFREFAAHRKVRSAAISLRRTRQRWEQCDAALRKRLPPSLLETFSMFEGVDAKAQAAKFLPDVERIEEQLSCRLWRGWAICEEEDLWNQFPELRESTGGDGIAAWCQYERMFMRSWRRDRARLWVDFYCRHLTFGDVGCSLSHLQLWEEALEEGVDVLIVFEDDTRPLPGAFCALAKEIQALEQMGIAWDVIMCHSTLYDKREEAPVGAGSGLVWSGHRKLTDFYVVSRHGLGRLVNSGLRDEVMPIDDFLPAAFRCSGHPRPDVMQTACVRRLREGGGDEGEGLAAFAFRENLSRNLARQVGSASCETPCIIGDHGAQCGPNEDEEVEHEQGPAGVVAPCVALCVGGESLEVEWHDRRSWATISGATTALRLLQVAEAEWAAWFLGAPEAQKRGCEGAGGRSGRLLLWGNGYSRTELREQFHVVWGCPDSQPYPDDAARSSLLALGAHLKAVCRALMQGIAPDVDAQSLGGGSPDEASVEDDLYAPSVMDMFFYPNAATNRAESQNMGSHLDPGFLTITSPSLVPGLQVWSWQTGSEDGGRWVDAEAEARRDQLIVLAGSELQDATGGRFVASPHRVVGSPHGGRLSCVFELRSM